MNRFTCLFLGLLGLTLATSVVAQGDLSVASGPMIGHVSMRSAQLWIQTTRPEAVFVKYKAQGEQVWMTTPTSNTAREQAYAAHVSLEDLEPGTRYEVQFVVGGEEISDSVKVQTQVLWEKEYLFV